MTQRGKDWCILRTGPARTLKLAASLQGAGIDAWSPVERQERRLPRSSAKRIIAVTLTPTYVFVHQRHLSALRRLERMEVSGHPAFSIFRYYGETVLVPHRALHALRAQEQDSYRASLPNVGKRATLKPRGEPFEAGALVTHKEGPLAGLPCYVEHSDDRHTKLRLRLFGRDSGVTVDTSMLRRNGVATCASAA